MPASSHIANSILQRILEGGAPELKADRLRSRLPEEVPLPPGIRVIPDYTPDALNRRREVLRSQGISTQGIIEGTGDPSPGELQGNIENLIGFARLPIGVIGPLRVNGIHAHGDFYVPLATTEGALVASYNRGATLLSRAGGAAVLCLTESVARAPCFVFETLAQVGVFLAWVLPQFDALKDVVAATSRHCRLLDLRTAITGREVHLIFEFTTGDASGQNMTTFATQAICNKLLEGSPVRPERWYLEGNLSGDKKATMLSFTYVRGKKVVAEAILPRALIQRILRVTPEGMVGYWTSSIVGGVQSGSIGVQGHYANAVAALFIACGQDVACVSEASIGLTRMDLTKDGSLYVSVTMPNLIVGTVGGGTWLPTTSECLRMMGCLGEGRARKFAEICCATALAGELSITGALVSGEFGKAHAKLGRKPART